MKKMLYLSGLILLAGTMGCNESQHSVTMDIDGVPWESNGGANGIKGDSSLLMNAFSDDFTVMALDLTNFNTAGTFTLDGTNNVFGYGTYSGPDITYNYLSTNSKPGTFTITSYDANDQNIKGTFSVTAFKDPGDSIVITNGKFDLNFQD